MRQLLCDVTACSELDVDDDVERASELSTFKSPKKRQNNDYVDLKRRYSDRRKTAAATGKAMVSYIQCACWNLR